MTSWPGCRAASKSKRSNAASATTSRPKIFSGTRGDLPAGVARRVDDFYRLLERIRAVAGEKTVADLMLFIFNESGLKVALKEDGEEGVERTENIQELINLAKRYDTLPKETALERFLEDTALLSDQDTLKEGRGGVRLMTVHAAKGLEFPFVFVAGLEEGLFPHASFGGGERDTPSHKEHAEEERRLFYVALTRAAKKLFLSYAETRTVFGSKEYNFPSLFIGDIPPELVEYDFLGEDSAPGETIEID